MTAEFGPRDVDLSLMERVAAHATRYSTKLFSDMANITLRFNPEQATLSLSGESQHPGEGFNRGLLVGLLYLLNLMLSVSVALAAAEAVSVGASTGPVVATIIAIPALFVVFGSMLVALGSIRLIQKTDVIDHTTEPEPEALAELREQFVDGEIDERELAARVEEVWERD